MTLLNILTVWVVRLLQAEQEQRPDLTLNYIIIAVLLVVAAVLSVIVVKRRMRERDDEWDT